MRRYNATFRRNGPVSRCRDTFGTQLLVRANGASSITLNSISPEVNRLQPFASSSSSSPTEHLHEVRSSGQIISFERPAFDFSAAMSQRQNSSFHSCSVSDCTARCLPPSASVHCETAIVASGAQQRFFFSCTPTCLSKRRNLRGRKVALVKKAKGKPLRTNKIQPNTRKAISSARRRKRLDKKAVSVKKASPSQRKHRTTDISYEMVRFGHEPTLFRPNPIYSAPEAKLDQIYRSVAHQEQNWSTELRQRELFSPTIREADPLLKNHDSERLLNTSGKQLQDYHIDTFDYAQHLEKRGITDEVLNEAYYREQYKKYHGRQTISDVDAAFLKSESAAELKNDGDLSEKERKLIDASLEEAKQKAQKAFDEARKSAASSSILSVTTPAMKARIETLQEQSDRKAEEEFLKRRDAPKHPLFQLLCEKFPGFRKLYPQYRRSADYIVRALIEMNEPNPTLELLLRKYAPYERPLALPGTDLEMKRLALVSTGYLGERNAKLAKASSGRQSKNSSSKIQKEGGKSPNSDSTSAPQQKNRSSQGSGPKTTDLEDLGLSPSFKNLLAAAMEDMKLQTEDDNVKGFAALSNSSINTSSSPQTASDSKKGVGADDTLHGELIADPLLAEMTPVVFENHRLQTSAQKTDAIGKGKGRGDSEFVAGGAVADLAETNRQILTGQQLASVLTILHDDSHVYHHRGKTAPKPLLFKTSIQSDDPLSALKATHVANVRNDAAAADNRELIGALDSRNSVTHTVLPSSGDDIKESDRKAVAAAKRAAEQEERKNWKQIQAEMEANRNTRSRITTALRAPPTGAELWPAYFSDSVIKNEHNLREHALNRVNPVVISHKAVVQGSGTRKAFLYDEQVTASNSFRVMLKRDLALAEAEMDLKFGTENVKNRTQCDVMQVQRTARRLITSRFEAELNVGGKFANMESNVIAKEQRRAVLKARHALIVAELEANCELKGVPSTEAIADEFYRWQDLNGRYGESARRYRELLNEREYDENGVLIQYPFRAEVGGGETATSEEESDGANTEVTMSDGDRNNKSARRKSKQKPTAYGVDAVQRTTVGTKPSPEASAEKKRNPALFSICTRFYDVLRAEVNKEIKVPKDWWK